MGSERALRKATLQVIRLPWVDHDGNRIQPVPLEISTTAAVAAVVAARKRQADGTATPKAIGQVSAAALVGKDAEQRCRDALREAQAADLDQEEEESLAPKTPAKHVAPKTPAKHAAPKTPPVRKAAAAKNPPAAPKKKAKKKVKTW
jgi:hypothetical protein